MIGEDGKTVLDKADKLFNLPVRVGHVCDEIAFFIAQKQLRQSLKPIPLGKFTLHPETLTLNDQKLENQIKITDKELSILLYLSQSHPKKVARDDMLHHVWQYAEGVETHTLETHIYRLRQKIEINPSEPEFLMTDDEGYYLNL
jgi:DNA-binding response OmpR family regulator